MRPQQSNEVHATASCMSLKLGSGLSVLVKRIRRYLGLNIVSSRPYNEMDLPLRLLILNTKRELFPPSWTKAEDTHWVRETDKPCGNPYGYAVNIYLIRPTTGSL